MKHRIVKLAIFHLRLAAIIIILLLPSLMIVSAKAEKFYTELWKELGITQQEGKARIKNGFIYGFLYDGGFRNIKNIIMGDKVAVVKDLLAYTKTYVYGDNFKEDYAEYREAVKPTLRMIPPTEPAIRKKYIDAIKLQMVNIKIDMKQTEGSIRKLYEDQYDLLERQILDFQDPQSKTMEFVMQNEIQQFNAAMNKYCEQLAQWELDYPVNEMSFIKLRLYKFLNETTDVDYSAKTININGRRHFEKAEYDLKPASWKYAFQAGEQVSLTVRSFVEEWVREIENNG